MRRLGFAVIIGAVLTASAAADQPRLANGAPYSFADLIEDVSPAVVSIDVESEQQVAQFDGFEEQFRQLPPEMREFFRQFGAPNADPRTRRRMSSGSGFFITADGYVVTNFHVVDGATTVRVSMRGGDEYEAEIVGLDAATDLAVLKVDADRSFPTVEFAQGEGPRVGDWVVAVGNPFRLGGTATAGIVSATGRELGGEFGVYNDFLQVDAPINPGNSGGPTFNLEGEVVGVNSQISSPIGANVGIGFAIPANIAADIVERLIDDGRVVRGWLGVSIQSISDDLAESYGLDDASGAFVGEVVPDSPAAEAGFRPDDVILAINGDRVADARDVTRRVGALEVGERTRFTVLRGARERTITVEIGARPTGGDDESAPPPQASQDLFGMRLAAPNADDRERLGLDENGPGLVIMAVTPGGEAAERGLRSGEAILSINGESVDSVATFQGIVDDARDKGRNVVRVRVTNGRGARAVPLRFAEE